MEKEQGMIELPFKLGLKVWNILQTEYNIEPRKNKIGLVDFHFTKEELGKITSIKIKNPAEGELVGISLLPNLEVLDVSSTGITAHKQPKNISSIGKEDTDEIARCKGLQ